MTTHVARITRSYQDISELITNWSSTATQVLVYEHASDEEIKKTHCHLLIIDCEIGQEGLKKRARDYNFSGNKDWSFSNPHSDTDKYVTYMTKGTLQPSYNKGFSPEFLELRKSSWISPPGEQAQPAAVIKPAEDHSLNALYQQYLNDVLGDDVAALGNQLTIDHFRGPSLSWWRKRNGGLLPQTSTYKRFLTSLYMEYMDLKRIAYSQTHEDIIKTFYA